MVENVPHNGEEKSSLLSTVLKIASVPIAAVAGWWVTAMSIRNSVYDRIKAHGGFASVKPNDAKYETDRPTFAFTPDSHKESANLIAKAAREQGAEAGFVNKIAELDRKTEKSIVQQLAKYDGLDKFTRQWKFSHLSHKQRALLEGFTAAGIAIGAIFAIANTKTISNAFASRDKEQQQDQPPSL